jgi:nucleoside phosphorylase
MQVDLGKTLDGGEMKRTATPRIPDQSLSKAVSALRARHELESSRLPQIVQQKLVEASEFAYPDKPDQLYKSSCSHTSPLSDCADCPSSELVSRTTRLSRDPVIHYCGIASSNQVMRSGTTRDLIARELDILCFEMEAAGLMDILPCLPVRGICDYADSHKNKEWQKYAAAVSAAYATELLGVLPSSEPQEILNTTRSFREYISPSLVMNDPSGGIRAH